MARLDKSARDSITTTLQARLPRHWKVRVGTFIEVDQDGLRPEHEFYQAGSTVIVIDNAEGGKVVADRYVRVPHPPGYLEGRQRHSTVASVRGRGWVDQIIEAVMSTVAEADAELASSQEADA